MLLFEAAVDAVGHYTVFPNVMILTVLPGLHICNMKKALEMKFHFHTHCVEREVLSDIGETSRADKQPCVENCTKRAQKTYCRR